MARACHHVARLEHRDPVPEAEATPSSEQQADFLVGVGVVIAVEHGGEARPRALLNRIAALPCAEELGGVKPRQAGHQFLSKKIGKGHRPMRTGFGWNAKLEFPAGDSHP